MNSRIKKPIRDKFIGLLFIVSLFGFFLSFNSPQEELKDNSRPAQGEPDTFFIEGDSLLNIETLDSIGTKENLRYTTLTDADFQLVAEELNVEIAAIKAVVEIEAGVGLKGFWAPGIPVINFDRTMYVKYRNKVENKEGAKGEKVPEGLKGYALKEWTDLINARKTNAMGANMGTFWGMFQIGGFNYKLCGCKDVNDFVRRVSLSELEQLQLFAVFIERSGMLDYLKKKDWRNFARRYNGPSYAKRGYHTRMAKAYKKYSS